MSFIPFESHSSYPGSFRNTRGGQRSGESCPLLGRPCSPGGSTTRRWRTWRAVGKLAMQQGPGALQASLGRPQHTWRAAQKQPRGHPELAGSGEHSLRRWHCLPKVKSASRAAPGPQVPLPAKGLKAPQPPARREAGWGRRRRSSNEDDPNGNVNLAERRNICNPTCKDEIPVPRPPPAILQDPSSRAGVRGPSSRIPNHTHPGSPKAAKATTPSPTVFQGLLPQNKNVHLATVPNPSQGKLCRNPGSG